MIIYGTIATSVEKKTAVESKKEYVEFRLAENWGKEETKTTTWYTVRAFINEVSADLLGRGVSVCVEGKLKDSAYLNKEGKPTTSLVVLAFKCEPSDRKNSSSNQA